MISTDPTSKRIILCIDTDEAILRYEKALLERSGAVLGIANLPPPGSGAVATIVWPIEKFEQGRLPLRQALES